MTSRTSTDVTMTTSASARGVDAAGAEAPTVPRKAITVALAANDDASVVAAVTMANIPTREGLAARCGG